MPNWCSNKIYVTGKNLQVFRDSLKIKVDGEDVDWDNFGFGQLYPEPTMCPQGEKKLDEHGFNHTENTCYRKYPPHKKEFYHTLREWYEWRCNHWGTKWEARECSIEDSEEEISIMFNTAWAPPREWCEYVTNKYDLEIIIVYCEVGCDFCGSITYYQGEITDQEEILIEWEPNPEYDEDDADCDEEETLWEYKVGSEFEKFMDEHKIGEGG